MLHLDLYGLVGVRRLLVAGPMLASVGIDPEWSSHRNLLYETPAQTKEDTLARLRTHVQDETQVLQGPP